jgi:hypothetical protein
LNLRQESAVFPRSREWNPGLQVVLAVVSIVAVLVIGAGTAAAASGAPSASAKPPKSAASGVGTCGASDASIPAPKVKPFKAKTLSAGGNPGFNITAFWAETAAHVAGEKVLDLGWELANKLITGNDPNQEILDKLDEVNAKLDDISSRLDTLADQITLLQNDFNQTAFKDQMARLCSLVIDQQNLYTFEYVPMVSAAVNLGQKFNTKDTPEDCKFPDAILKRCLTPLELATRSRNEFVDYYKSNQQNLLNGITTIHNALMPGSPSGSVLAAKGKVLMASRYVTRAQSEVLQSLYSDLHQAEALASWMATEYWVSHASQESVTPPQLFNFEKIVDDYLKNADAEQKSLPRMIPEDAVLDLGMVNPPDANNKQMWLPPTLLDQGWFPGISDDNPPISFGPILDAENVVNNGLNATPGGFTNWRIPTKAEMLRLMQNCVGTKCTNAFKAPQTVADYLRSLNPNNFDWETLFCDPKGHTISCLADPDLHKFVWTAEVINQSIDCGYEFGFLFIHIVSHRTYHTHTGILTASTNPADQIGIPKLPGEIPAYQNIIEREAHRNCDDYMKAQVTLPKNQGIVLATRGTNASDLSQTGRVDYMGQQVLAP